MDVSNKIIFMRQIMGMNLPTYTIMWCIGVLYNIIIVVLHYTQHNVTI